MDVAIIIPCLNEEITVAQVIRHCQQLMPKAVIYVLDNGSTDNTAESARDAGAIVIPSPSRGKGNVLRHAFRVIDSEYYIMIDGDGTYGIDEGKRLLEIAIKDNYEMVMGSRLEQGEASAFRPGHLFGNHLFTGIVRFLFQYPVRDLMTGLRIFSKRFVQETQIISRGFEIETELTIRAICQDLAFCEVPINYVKRPLGSKSKLSTYRDGFKILMTIIRLWKDFHPLAFFTVLSTLLMIAGRIPKSTLSDFLSSCAAIFFCMGFYFDNLIRLQRMHRNTKAGEAHSSHEKNRKAG